MDKLPLDIVNIIYEYVPIESLALCSKEKWLIAYKIRNPTINTQYLVFITKYDLSFILDNIISMHQKILVKKRKKKINYHDKIFTRQIDMIKYLLQNYSSNKSMLIVNNFMKTERLVFKNIKRKYNRWSN